MTGIVVALAVEHRGPECMPANWFGAVLPSTVIVAPGGRPLLASYRTEIIVTVVSVYLLNRIFSLSVPSSFIF